MTPSAMALGTWLYWSPTHPPVRFAFRNRLA